MAKAVKTRHEPAIRRLANAYVLSAALAAMPKSSWGGPDWKRIATDLEAHLKRYVRGDTPPPAEFQK